MISQLLSLFFTKMDPAILYSRNELTIDQIKERAKILFIDDQDVSLIPILQNERWNISHWKDILNLQDLEKGKFDLIFLDIGGVGRRFSPTDEGIAILKRIKEVNPSVLIIAYSGQSFDVGKSEFWRLADDHLSKSSGALPAIEKIESLLKRKWTPKQLWLDVVKSLEDIGADERTIKRIKKDLLKSVNHGKFDENYFSRLLKDFNSDDTSTGAALGIISKASAIISLIMKYQ